MNVWRPIVSCGEFTEQVQGRLGRTSDVKAHVGVGVHQHVWKAWIWNPCHDVSKKHFEANLHARSVAVSLSITVIGA